MREIPKVDDDGLVIPDVREWGEEKYLLVQCFASIFTKAMSEKWDQLVYIDLFSGAGYARTSASKIVKATPLLVLDIEKPFSKYVFCELDGEKLDALRQRIARHHPRANVSFVAGDSNNNIGQILSQVPRGSKSSRVLSFCFADPFNLSNLNFATLKALADNLYIDFLVLVPSGMDATRNEVYYLKPENRKVADFTGSPNWRENWLQASKRNQTFGNFVVDEFGASMASMKYIYSPEQAQLIRSTEKNLALYHLLMLSRHPLGSKFWEECRKYSSVQRGLPF